MTFFLTQESNNLRLLKCNRNEIGSRTQRRNNVVPSISTFDNSDASRHAMQQVEDAFGQKFSCNSAQYIQMSMGSYQQQLQLVSEWNANKETLSLRLEGYILKVLRDLLGAELEVRVVVSDVQIYLKDVCFTTGDIATKGMKISLNDNPMSEATLCDFPYNVNTGVHLQVQDHIALQRRLTSIQIQDEGQSYASCEDSNVTLLLTQILRDPGNRNRRENFLIDGKIRVQVTIPGSKSSIFHSGSQFKMARSINMELLYEGSHADLKVIASNRKEIKAHRCFLSIRSPVFAAMFRNDCKESLTRRIEIPEMSEKAVNAFLAYLYFGDLSEAEKDSEIAMDLFEAGHKYEVPSLEECSKQILLQKPKDWVAVDVALRVFIFAGRMGGCADLMDMSIQVMKLKFRELKESEEYSELFHKDPATAMELCAYAFTL